jgi:hypothetical protein
MSKGEKEYTMHHARGLGLRGSACVLAAVLLSSALSARAEAATVVPMTVQTLSENAGQVIGGEVVSVRSYWAENPRRIESEVTFQNVEYLKGKLADSTTTFKLLVPGGKVGDWQMRISCAPTFAPGEKWVLFLLPTYRTFPVVGLHEGAFRIESDAEGVARVYDASGGAVIGLGEDNFLHVAEQPAEELSAQAGKDAGHNAPAAQHPKAQDNLIGTDGVRVQFVGPPAPETKAVSYDDFVALIRPVLERSKAHNLTTPAGRPILTGYKPVPLKLAPSATKASPGAAGVRSGGTLPRKVELPARQPRAQQSGVGESAKGVQR